MASLLSAEHLLTLAVIALVTTALIVFLRAAPPGQSVATCRLLAVVIVVNELGFFIWAALNHFRPADGPLPLQLCDVAAFVTAAALWTRRPLLAELTYVWGLAGTVNGLLTPDINRHFPDYLYFQYFIAHGGIVAAALVLVVGLRIRPRPWAPARVFLLTVGLLAVDGLIDLATGDNYLYLRHTPGVHSALDLFGPWPLYIVGAAGVALVAFIVLDLPFSLGRRLHPASGRVVKQSH
ncbi:MAG: hypothetical protein NVS9B1_09110 [Candidatus Dormibacteraceae bacterium]